MKPEELYNLYLQHPVICTDSRSISPGSLFFALRGEHFDANSFAAQAIDKGAAYSIIDNPRFSGERTILVDNVLDTLQKLAALQRKSLQIPVIGITGSNGKTTTKELINAVLSSKYKTTATQGNLNNHIGVPLTLLSVDRNTEIAIVEMGANHVGEIEALCKISQPTCGIITNIGKAHLEGFGSYEGVIKAKSELYGSIRRSGGIVFVNADDALLMNLSADIIRIPYGTSMNLESYGIINKSSLFLELAWIFKEKEYFVQTQLVGSYNFSNVMAALTIGVYLGIEPELCVKAVENYRPKNNRSEWVDTGKNKVILDAYNANPSSMEAAIRNFSMMEGSPKMVILGGMKELGAESNAEHHSIIRLVASLGFERVFFAGPEFMETVVASEFPVFENAGLLLEKLSEMNLSGYHILIKGSRGTAMEKVMPAL